MKKKTNSDYTKLYFTFQSKSLSAAFGAGWFLAKIFFSSKDELAKFAKKYFKNDASK